jgi:nucleotide-binding universal stress UspA family protein
MSILEHMAVAVDFSHASRLALASAFRLAKIAGGVGKLTVLNATEKVVLPKGDQPILRERLEKLQQRLVDTAEGEIQKMVEDLHAEGFEVDCRVRPGLPAEVIPQLAEEVGATVLAIGSHGRTGISRWIQGSVAEALLRQLKMPILVFPRGTDEIVPEEELRTLQGIVVAVEREGFDSLAVETGFELALRFPNPKPRLTVLHVNTESVRPRLSVSSLESDDGLVAEYLQLQAQSQRAALDALLGKYSGQGVSVEFVELEGDPAEKILECAEERFAKLVVLGSRSGGFVPMLLHSVANHLIRHGDLSILIVPSQEAGEDTPTLPS